MRTTSRFGLALALALVTNQPAAAADYRPPAYVTVESSRPHGDELAEGVRLMQASKPAEAEKIFSAIIADMEQKHDPGVPYRCAYDTDVQTTVEYTSRTLNKAHFILGSDVWCTALWGEGFVLIDLNRADEAGVYLARSVEMMPMNAHFINEYAEWYKSKHQFQTSYDLFLRAWHTVSHDSNGPDRKVAARSLRGLAFNLIELGDLDGAERLYRQSLDFQPEAADKVQNELDYIAQQRAKK